MTGRALVVPLLLALCAASCAGAPTSSLDAFAQRSANNSFEPFDRGVDPPATLVLAVEHDRQTAGPSCGAHALASVVNYWRGAGTVSGEAMFAAHPPANPAGYSLAEITALARGQGLLASAVRLGLQDIIRELESGRPVLTPVRVPAVFIQPWSLPAANANVAGAPARIVSARVGWLSELTGMGMVNHYLLVVGYQNDMFVVVEPILGFRTIEADRFERYREAFGNSAVVFSADRPPAAAAGGAAARANR